MSGVERLTPVNDEQRRCRVNTPGHLAEMKPDPQGKYVLFSALQEEREKRQVAEQERDEWRERSERVDHQLGNAADCHRLKVEAEDRATKPKGDHQ